MTTPDPTLAARLAELRAKATDDNLNGQGHYFGDCGDLTQCGHGDCGYFQNRHDGPFLAALWNAYRSGQLITTAEADARVEAAVVAERERQKAAEWEDSDHITLAHMLGVDAAQLAVDFCQIGLFPCVGVDEGGEYALGPFTDSAGNNIAGCASVYFSEDKRYEWSAYMEIGDAIIKGHWPIGTMPDEIAAAIRARGVTG